MAEQNAITGQEDMADHKHGTMDIEVQEQTFEGFIKFCIRVCVVIFCIVVFMALFNS